MTSVVDTNLFNKVKRNAGGIHDKLVAALGEGIYKTQWFVPPFGWLEYLGLSFNGMMGVPAKPDKYTLSGEDKATFAQLIAIEGEEFVSNVHWVRTQAKSAFEAKLTQQVLDVAIAEDRKYHSKEFTDGPFGEVLFETPAKKYPASDLCELLTIDFVHRFPNYPNSMTETLRQMYRVAIVSEYYVEKRNVHLFRGAKQAWLARVKGAHEKGLSKGTLEGIERAMRELKPDADRLDHDLLAYFLLGFFTNGKYEPIVAYTQDDPKQVMFRLAVFFCIIETAWEECSEVKGVGPLEFMRTSKVCFVGDDGAITSEITSDDLVKFMTAEKILVMK